MKKFKFKSIAMRIWVTFTSMILIIICSISFLYLLTFGIIGENARIQDLKVAHDILIKENNFSQPNRFDELRNLRGSNYYILNINDNNVTKIIEINKRQGIPPMRDQSSPPISVQSPPSLFDTNSDSVKMWMASFIKTGDIYEKQFKASYNHIKFIFIISQVNYGSTGKSYLITYMPEMQDNILLYLVFIVGAVFIAISFFTAKVVANNISKPLKELEDYTIRIAHKDWKEPIYVKSEDEIGRLASSMNNMQKELKRAEEEEKMFLQSISHDLKTPVMVIMSHAEAIIDGVYIESVEKTAEIIKDEAISLNRKIKQILYLNTLDYVLENKNESIEINLRDLIMHVVSRFEVINSKIEWELDINEIFVQAKEDKIQVAIENILENGLRYVEQKICVSLKAEGLFAVLEIYNDGPNIDNAHIGHIFDNFYKDKTGNFGLGLAISKKIIDFYNGEVIAINRDKGVSFIIRLNIKNNQV